MTNWQIIWTSVAVMIVANVGEWFIVEESTAWWVMALVYFVALTVFVIFFIKEIKS